jgi:hypothetical protein
MRSLFVLLLGVPTLILHLTFHQSRDLLLALIEKKKKKLGNFTSRSILALLSRTEIYAFSFFLVFL